MTTAAQLFEGLDCTILGNGSEEVGGLAYRSDAVQPGDMFFAYGATGLVPVDEPDTLYFSTDAANFDDVFGRNTGYVIDPEETLADNFAYALVYGPEGREYPNPEIINAILDYLKK